MGHSSVRMTAGYAHGTPAAIRRAMDKFSKKRGEVVESGRKAG